jgi:hypothetical protein
LSDGWYSRAKERVENYYTDAGCACQTRRIVKDLVTAVASSALYAQAIRMENAFLPSLRRILTQKPQRLVPAVRNIVAHRRTGMIRIAGLALSDFL